MARLIYNPSKPAGIRPQSSTLHCLRTNKNQFRGRAPGDRTEGSHPRVPSTEGPGAPDRQAAPGAAGSWLHRQQQSSTPNLKDRASKGPRMLDGASSRPVDRRPNRPRPDHNLTARVFTLTPPDRSTGRHSASGTRRARSGVPTRNITVSQGPRRARRAGLAMSVGGRSTLSGKPSPLQGPGPRGLTGPSSTIQRALDEQVTSKVDPPAAVTFGGGGPVPGGGRPAARVVDPPHHQPGASGRPGRRMTGRPVPRAAKHRPPPSMGGAVPGRGRAAAGRTTGKGRPTLSTLIANRGGRRAGWRRRRALDGRSGQARPASKRARRRHRPGPPPGDSKNGQPM